MLTQILLLLAGGLFMSLLVTLAINSIRSKIAWLKFKKLLDTNKVYFLDSGRSWFSNNFQRVSANKNVQYIHELHQKHGPYLGAMIHEVPTLSTVDLDLIHKVVHERREVNRLAFKLPMKEYEQDCILFAEGEQWRRIRRSFAPALKPARFKAPNVVHDIEVTINKTIAAIEAKLNQQELENGKMKLDIDADDVMHRYSLNIVMLCFYKQPHVVEFDLNKECNWCRMIDHGFKGMNDDPIYKLGALVPAIRKLIDWSMFYLHPNGKWRTGILGFIKRQARIALEARKYLAEMRNSGQQINDANNFILPDGTKFNRNITDYIIDEFHSGKLSRNECFNSSLFLFSAADKTASDALVYTLYELAMRPEIQNKLRDSIRACGVDSEYLAWVINESLRLSPPAPGGCARTLSEDLILPNEMGTLPKGTFVFTPLYTIHRLEKYWGEDANEFRPERWSEADKFHPAQFMPFGAGARQCLGKEFALFSMKMLICALLDRYKFECRGPKEDLNEFSSPLFIFMVHKSPFHLILSRL